MDLSTTNYSRMRRSTAEISKHHDEQNYVFASFPQLNKHSIIPAAGVNINPLNKQTGTIKTFGSRKNLRIIGIGSKEEMKNRASRYAVSTGSEEVKLVPDEQEDDDYSPSCMYSLTKKQITTSEQSKSQTQIISSNINRQTMTIPSYDASLLKKNLSSHRKLNFDRIYPSETGVKRRYNNDHDESASNGSDETDDEDDEHLYVMKKSCYKNKKQAIESVKDGRCSGCIECQKEIIKLSKRLDRLEKFVSVIEKFRMKTPQVSPNVMGELIERAGHIDDKAYLEKNEDLFKEFIQIKCMILDGNIDSQWKEISNSLGR